jgi:hypothetical protein
VPAILEIGRESIQGAGVDALLDEAAEALIEDAMALDDAQGILV